MWAKSAKQRTTIFCAALIASALALPACARRGAVLSRHQPQYPRTMRRNDAERRRDDGDLSAALQRQVVAYPSNEPAGTIVIDTAAHLPLSDARRRQGAALRHRRRPPGLHLVRHRNHRAQGRMAGLVSAGRDGRPAALSAALRRRRPGNPLGARAMYLGNTDYRIHGTNDPSSIGKHMSSGCIRLLNADVIDLYSRVGIGTKVVVLPNDQRQAAIDDGRPRRQRRRAQDARSAVAAGFRVGRRLLSSARTKPRLSWRGWNPAIGFRPLFFIATNHDLQALALK